jgi:hypothetical protein
MKTCPKCKLDYSNEFYYCEFDGLTLIESTTNTEHRSTFSRYVLSMLSNLNNKIQFFLPRNPMKYFLMAAIVLITTTLIGTYALQNQFTNRDREKPGSVLITNSQPPVFVETPKAALNFNDQDQNLNSPVLEDQNIQKPQIDQKNSSGSKNPDRPGVVVFPQHKPQANRPDDQINMPPVLRPQPNSQTAKPVVRVPNDSDSPRLKTPKVNQTPRPYSPIESTTTALLGVSIKLIRISPRSTAQGQSYEVTLSVQNNSGQLIQWENLTLAAQGVPDNLSVTHPFMNRLGSPGNIVFTYKSPNFYTTTTNADARLQCSLSGRTVNNSRVKVSVSTSVPN